MTQMNLSPKQKQTHRHREQTCGCQGRQAMRGMNWEFGVGRYKLLRTEWINKVLHSTGNYGVGQKVSLCFSVITEAGFHLQKNLNKIFGQQNILTILG